MSKTGRLRDVQDYSSLSSNSLDRMEERNDETLSNRDAECTQDGSLDCRGNPASKHKTGNWKACPFILGNECCERLAYYGISTNLVNYIHTKFNEDSSTASNSVTNWSGTCYITPLIGAFMADAYWGRYWTIAVFSCVYFVGMSLLTISSSVPKLKPPCSGNDSECHPSAAHIGVFYLALYLIALGTGGIKPCVSSFGADQFDETDKTEQKRKSSFFNWFYFSINIGALISSSVLVWIQENVGWSWGFGIPTVAMAIAVVSFFSGTVLYRHQKPGGSPLTRIAQVLVASIRKWNVKTPEDSTQLFDYQDKESGIEGSRKLLHTKQFRCLDKAAIPTANDESKGGSLSPWKLCTVTQVEELKAIIRILPIWATGIVFNTVYSQMSTLFVLQGDTMDPHIGSFKIPAASLSIFDTLSVLIWVPIYDRIIVPVVRRYTGHQRGFTQLQRMGIGLLISIFSMVVAAIVEIKRLQIVRKHNYYNLETIPMSILWQIFQYFLIGAAEVFNNIGQIEFFYDQAPDAMRSLCSALSLTTNALGNYLSTLLVTVVTHITRRNGKPGWIPDNLNYGHIDYFFWLLAVLSFLNLLVYLGISHWYKYKKTSGSFQVSK